MLDVEKLMEGIQDYIARALRPLAEKIAEIEAKKPEKGADGKDGAPGKDGRDADPENIKRLVSEAVASLPMPKDGRNGCDGKDGAPGKDGKDADISHLEAHFQAKLADLSEKIAAFEQKIAAIPIPKDGRDGRDGKDGADGRDGAAISILPSIDAQRSYARGIFACHKGGLWRSTEQTNGMDGWECVIEGLHSVDLEHGAGRKFSLVFQKSAGTAEALEFELPLMIYRGVWKQGEGYETGDCVTWAGSLWHCDEANDQKPGEGKGWTLVAKRGRDGKDGHKS